MIETTLFLNTSLITNIPIGVKSSGIGASSNNSLSLFAIAIKRKPSIANSS